MKHVLVAAMCVTSAACLSAQQVAQSATAGPQKGHVIVAVPNAIQWGPAPDILPAGARAVILEGNPGNPGDFTLRLLLPANYRIAPHYHPVTEHVTVISGTFYVGMGEAFDVSKGTELPAGTFAALDPGMRHFAYTKTETVIQLHGVGPWSLVYVNPADDPRNKAK
ncbi:MAG: cupin domain-containing protein [Gemmatimonadaceae bacterium]